MFGAMGCLALKGEKGWAGATFTVTIGLREAVPGDRIMEEFLADKRGRERRSSLTRGSEPNPWYFGLNAEAPAGGCSLFFVSLGLGSFWPRTNEDNLDVNPGDRTSARKGAGKLRDCLLKLGEFLADML